MTCRECCQLMEEALDGTLCGKPKQRFDRHLSQCDACRSLMAAMVAEHMVLSRAMHAPETMRLLPSKSAMIERLRSVRPVSTQSHHRNWSWRRVAACLTAFAAFVAVASAVTAKVVQSRNQEETPQIQEFKSNEGESEMNKREVKTAAVLAATAASVTLAPVAQSAVEWPANSCIYAGNTNRTCQATDDKTLSGTLDSYWLEIASATNGKRFYRSPAAGMCIVIR